MTNVQSIDNIDIAAMVLQFDLDMYQTAIVGQLAQKLVDNGSLTFPIETEDALQPLFMLARTTQVPGLGTLRPPASAEIPETLFPVRGMRDLLQVTLALCRFLHAIPMPPPKA